MSLLLSAIGATVAAVLDVSLSSRCMIGACDVSMPPSSPCNQLHSWITFVTCRFASGACVQANFGNGGMCSTGPRYAHIIPPNSHVG